MPSACMGRTPGVVSGRTRTTEPGEKRGVGDEEGTFSLVISQEDEATEPRYAEVRFPLLLQKKMVMVNYFWGRGNKLRAK